MDLIYINFLNVVDGLNVMENLNVMDADDLERLSLDRERYDLYLTGRAKLEFDARPPFCMTYSKKSEV